MCGSLPPGWHLMHDGKAKPVPPEGVEPFDVPHGMTAASLKPPLDGTLSADDLDGFRARLSTDLQLHKHTARCRKGGRAGTDADCAMDGVRRLHPATSYTDGVLLARLDVANMVFHSPTLSMAFRGNNAVFVFPEQSKFNLRLQQHLEALARGEAVPSDAPKPLTTAEASADANAYSGKYTSKHDFAPRSANAIAKSVENAQVRAIRRRPLRPTPLQGSLNTVPVPILSNRFPSAISILVCPGEQTGGDRPRRRRRRGWPAHGKDAHQRPDRGVRVLRTVRRPHTARRQGLPPVLPDLPVPILAVCRGGATGERRRAGAGRAVHAGRPGHDRPDVGVPAGRLPMAAGRVARPVAVPVRHVVRHREATATCFKGCGRRRGRRRR